MRRKRFWAAAAIAAALAVVYVIPGSPAMAPAEAPAAVAVPSAFDDSAVPVIQGRVAEPPSLPAAPPATTVAPSVPTSFVMSGPAFTVQANVCQMENVRPLDPPGDQRHTVCWVRSGFGVAPGSNSGGTSYILGHSWSRAKLVFNPLSELAMTQVDLAHPVAVSGVPTYPVTVMDGYRITLGTATGSLVYTVRDAYAVNKMQAALVAPLMAADTPNRVVLITCAVSGGVDADYNIVVDAYLSHATAK